LGTRFGGAVMLCPVLLKHHTAVLSGEIATRRRLVHRQNGVGKTQKRTQKSVGTFSRPEEECRHFLLPFSSP